MKKRQTKSAAKVPRKTTAKTDDTALQGLRGKIDALDAELEELISQRARYAKEIGVLKGVTSTAEFYRPEREAQVLRRVVERNKGPLRNEEMVRLFREMMSACLAQEEPLKVAYLGPEGTFTQSAVLKHFGHSVHALSVPTIDEVFHEVEAGTADFGVAPIENSSEGTVNIHTLDMFLTSPLKVCGEIELRIHQHLMGHMANIKGIKRVCSHPQSLAQCKAWLVGKPAGRGTGARGKQRRGRAPRSRRGRHGRARRRSGRESLRSANSVPDGRGPRRQQHAFRRRRAQAVPAERQRQDVIARFGQRHQRPRRAAPSARTR